MALGTRQICAVGTTPLPPRFAATRPYAFVRLFDVNNAQQWNSRGHFFAAAAEAMRRILVENARRRRQLKRGAGFHKVGDHEITVVADNIQEDLIALDDALTKLSDTDPQAARLIQLRYFVGLSIPDAAKAVGISPRTADRLWAFARAWLHRELSGVQDSEENSSKFLACRPRRNRTVPARGAASAHRYECDEAAQITLYRQADACRSPVPKSTCLRCAGSSRQCH